MTLFAAGHGVVVFDDRKPPGPLTERRAVPGGLCRRLSGAPFLVACAGDAEISAQEPVRYEEAPRGPVTELLRQIHGGGRTPIR